MTAHRSIFIAATAAPLGTQPIDARLALSGLVANAGNGGASPLGARPGLFYDGSGLIVVGSTATSPMTYFVKAFVGCAQLLGTATSGLALFANDGTVTLNTIAAPGSNSRIDVIWVRQHALAADGGADADNILEIGVTNGTAAASPTVPAIPTGAMALAQAVILSSTTQTSTAAITQVHNYTATSGSPIPVRTQAERDAMNAYAGLTVYRLDTLVQETWDGTLWRQVAAYARQTGTVNVVASSLASSGFATFAVSFAAGRFTQVPIVQVTLQNGTGGSASATVRATAITTSGFSVCLANTHPTAAMTFATTPCAWTAEQMLPLSAAG